VNNILRNRVGDKRGTWVPNQRDYLHRILLIRAHNSCNKIISCKGQLITPQGTIPEGESFQSPQLPYASWPLPDIGLCIRGSCTNKYDSLHLTLPLLPPPLCILQSMSRNAWFPPAAPVLPFNIQYWHWYWQYRVKANVPASCAGQHYKRQHICSYTQEDPTPIWSVDRQPSQLSRSSEVPQMM